MIKEKEASVIDKRAEIHASAKIAAGVTIGPWSVIGADVEIGEGTVIESHVVIKGPTTIGKHNHIYQFSSIGEDPQDLKFRGEKSRLEIGDHNLIREFVTLNRGTEVGGNVTKIGSHNLLMAYVHIAHDCIVGDHIIFANNASLSGHVIVEDYVNLGGFSAVHQFCRIGTYAFVARSMVTKDVLPYVKVAGPDSGLYGINRIGLERHGFDEDSIAAIQKAYKIIFRNKLTVEEALAELKPLAEKYDAVQALVDGLNKSTRGILR